MNPGIITAGLFSAVLSAFVIESYQNLSEDNSATTVQLLRQISRQTNSYTSLAGALNPTVSPPASNEFQAFTPSTSAICVNLLWFASLILSLMTASFGILVKQWLREYLAGEYTSPLARLRAWIANLARHPSLGPHLIPLEDEDALENESGADVAILSALDSIMMDEDLLSTTMFESLQQTHAEPSAAIYFAIGALQRRIPSIRFPAQSLPLILDLSQLRYPVWKVLTEIAAQTLLDHIQQLTELRIWIHGSLSLVAIEMLVPVDEILVNDATLRIIILPSLHRIVIGPQELVTVATHALSRRLDHNVFQKNSSPLPDLRALNRTVWTDGKCSWNPPIIF
ncbi:hypothetical protein PHLCEN_2v13465 [Hermanssonia centrifuga]|uniref:DUF6535 domain-containing protein n=1 Tax=Hermanssonia centrifuga TaxID=98765 RepID=A0A2R6NE57_9APHY|nr:hypothetical protein PHLCEN_2v13465 [Hermanssonia centrifuga]